MRIQLSGLTLLAFIVGTQCSQSQIATISTHPGALRGTVPVKQPSALTSVTPGIDPQRPGVSFEERIPKGDTVIELQLIVDGLVAPLGVHTPNDGSGRLFVHDQIGVVWVIDPATGSTNVLLDVRDRLVPLMPGYDERGLIGFTIHTNFAAQPFVYTYTTEPATAIADFTLPKPADQPFDHQNVIAEWRLDPANSNRVDVTSRREILRIDQPLPNHNAGTIAFGPDGLFYMGLGDGGGADDQDGQPFLGQVTWGHGPIGNGQNITTLHGSFLRIDVHGTNSANGKYGLPTDNPFAGATNGLAEIYAYGFRNPYFFSFDRTNGDIYLSDAGEKSIEEVDRVVRGGNYGWNLKEGSFFFELNGEELGYATNKTSQTLTNNLVDPIAEFSHQDGHVIIGGFVYRGTNIPSLTGKYLASDFLMQNEPQSRLVYVDLANTNASSRTALQEIKIGLEDRRPGFFIRGFGEDNQGELYAVASNEVGPMGNSGKVFKIVAPPAPINLTGISRGSTNLVTTTNGLPGTNVITSTNLSIAWSGGTGPFGVEHKVDLLDLLWNLRQVTGNQTAVLPSDAPAEFLRVSEKPHRVMTAFSAHLSGTNERPTTVNTPAWGTGHFLLEGNSLTYLLVYSNLTSTATVAHVHGPAMPEQAASPLFPLEAFGGPLSTGGVFAATVLLTDEQRLAIENGEAYANVHSAQFPEGEIRGQLIPAGLSSSLRGAWERPTPVLTPAIGNSLMALVGSKLTFILNYRDLSSPATAAHIHGPAETDEVAPPIIDLTSFILAGGTNGTIAGTILLTDQQLAWLAEGRTYLNVHSQSYTNGEIRGQIFTTPGVVPLTTFLTGQAQQPPVNTLGGGVGILALAGGNHLLFEMSYTNLTGVPTAAHIHGPASITNNAPPVVPLESFIATTSTNAGFLSGMVDLPASVVVDLLNLQTYVNIHTAANPDGEIRSQIAPLVHKAALNGTAERPISVPTPGLGAGLFLLQGDVIDIFTAYGQLTAPASAAHIHGPASMATAADVLLPLPVDPAPHGVIMQSIRLLPAEWINLVGGLTYINVHSTNYPSGEIRGQILP